MTEFQGDLLTELEAVVTAKWQYDRVSAREQACSRGGRNLRSDLEYASKRRLLHIARWQDTKRTKHHPRQSHLVKPSEPFQISILNTSIPTVWMANGRRVRRLHTICHPAG